LAGCSVEPGTRVLLERDDGLRVEGVVMPRYALADREVLVVKLDNGYNIGIRCDRIQRIEPLEKARPPGPAGVPAPLSEEALARPGKRVMVIGTGGTIASRIDYETGAVRPYIDAEELVQAIPEAAAIAEISAEEIMQVFSENMEPKLWERIVEEVERRLNEGYDGIVVAHGTDTMGYTAAALSFAFHRGLPAPVILVGAQRSSDRPSSDAAFNFTAAVLTAVEAPFGEVAVVMHGTPSDTYALAHRGTRVRKMHSSRRDAFQSINTVPLAKVWPYERRIEMLRSDYKPRLRGAVRAENGFEERVALLKYYPGMREDIIEHLASQGYKGIVIEGTGFGHVAERLIPVIKRAVDNGVAVVAATQTVFGRVNLNVYATGRKMLAAGVIPADDMLAETAYVKLSWALRRARDLEEVRRIMLTPLAGEIGERQSLRYYPSWHHGPA